VSVSKKAVFLDTFFVQALLNRRDNFHSKAKALFPQVQVIPEVWTTEAVLIEVGNSLASINRKGAAEFIRKCYSTPHLNVISVDSSLLARAVELYQARTDKEWGLTDCISFVVMKEQGITHVLSADVHFKQAGFNTLL
jgi:predicted nucleic acid-binding protein